MLDGASSGPRRCTTINLVMLALGVIAFMSFMVPLAFIEHNHPEGASELDVHVMSMFKTEDRKLTAANDELMRLEKMKAEIDEMIEKAKQKQLNDPRGLDDDDDAPMRLDPVSPPIAPGGKSDPENDRRRQAVIDGMKHAWGGYKEVCFGKDELKPLSRRCEDWLGQGMTIIDSLDTLWYMGLKDEYEVAKRWVVDKLSFANFHRPVSFFETVIRSLGGLLSAYDVDPDPAYLAKAKDLADRLLRAWNSFGLPLASINLITGHATAVSWARGQVLLAEIGTIQLEFYYLSKKLGDPKYAEKVERVIDIIDTNTLPHAGLPPIYMNPRNGQFDHSSSISFGAMGDSYFEYLVKMWVLKGKKDPQYKRMYLDAMSGMIRELVKTSGQHMYVAEMRGNRPVHKMDHLACFVPGMLALGVINGVTSDPAVLAEHTRVAKGLAETCYRMYKLTGTGISPEAVQFDGSSMRSHAKQYHQRPEAVEALFMLYRLTHEQKYRDWAWEIFQAIEKNCKVATGYASLSDSNNANSKTDKMESFFLAETLKYLFLIFSDDSAMDITKKVFNTEAHPLSVFDA